ncbi:MAG: M48 family metallopeptidase [Clostridia bacterium]|nr:M48 family metallopeptidase [Clostridia bacterium]
MEYELIRSDRRTIAAQIKDGRLIVRAPRRASEREIRLFLDENADRIGKHLEKAREREKAKAGVRRLTDAELSALKKRAEEVIPERARHYAPLVGVTFGRITIRRMKTRWGSCTSKGDLTFNSLLMLAPDEVVDSVVVHELCHRRVMDHSRAFYNEVLRVFPEYRKHNKWLKENGDLLTAAAERE